MKHHNSGSVGSQRRFLVMTLIVMILAMASNTFQVSIVQADDDGTLTNTIFLPLVSMASATQATVDPRVLEDTANEQSGRFLVVLKEQARPQELVSSAANHATQGALVMNALRSTAVASQAPVAAELDALGATYRAYWVANFFAVEGNRAVVDAMAARPDVLAIESNRTFQVALEPVETVEASDMVQAANVTAIGWNLTWISAPAVWALGATGQNTVYANADTGVQWTHPALQPHYRGWNGESADHNYSWWDAIHSDIDDNGNPCGFNLSAPCDDQGHGTHTMGIGIGDDGSGNQIGVAPGAKWIACRNMDAGVGRPSTYLECMQFFLAPTDLNGNNPDPSRRPDVVGNSYVCPTSELCNTTSMLTAMESLRSAGIFMVTSAGNSGSSCSTISDPPAIHDSTITVGATGNQTDLIASYSSRGPVTSDGSGRAKPDLVAPGSSIRSSFSNGAYATLSGTSMAAPHVGGAVALLWSAFPHLRGNVDHTEFILKQTAVRMTTTQGCGGDGPTQVPNNVYGHGRINILAAYNFAAAEVAPTPTNTPVPTELPTNTPVPTELPTNTPVPTELPANTPTPTALPTNTPTPTALPTNTPTPTTAPSSGNTGFLKPNVSAAQSFSAGDNNGFESSSTNALTDGGGYARDNNSGVTTTGPCTANGTDKHRFYNYNITLPAGAAVTGIEVRLDASVDAVGTNAPAMCVQLSRDGGVTWTTAKQTARLTTLEATYILGGAADTWGLTWSATNLSNTSFRVRVSNVATGANANQRDFSLDWIAVRVTYR